MTTSQSLLLWPVATQLGSVVGMRLSVLGLPLAFLLPLLLTRRIPEQRSGCQIRLLAESGAAL